MAHVPPENRNGRILQGRWGNDVRRSIIELNVKDYGLVEELRRGGTRILHLGFARLASGSGASVPTFLYDLYRAPGGAAGDLIAEDVGLDYTRCSIDRLAAETDQPCTYWDDAGTIKIHQIFERPGR